MQSETTESRAEYSYNQHLDLVHNTFAKHQLVRVAHALYSRVCLSSTKQHVTRETLVDGLEQIREVERLLVLQRGGEKLGQTRAE